MERYLVLMLCLIAASFCEPVKKMRTAMGRILDTNKNRKDLLHGDIKEPLIQAALLKQDVRWPNGILHYTINQNHFNPSQIAQIKAGMADISSRSCVTFQEHSMSSAPRQHVEIIDDGACYSWVGRQQDTQQLSLAKWGCLYHGTIVHELLHALGFDHEQNRKDRDDYVRILFENVQSGQSHNFEKADTDSLGVRYDPKSVMQYENDAWSRNGRDTIQWLADTSMRLGGEELTDLDVLQLNLYYKCQDPVTTTTTTTAKPTTKTMTTEVTTTTKMTTQSTMVPTKVSTVKPTTDILDACGDYSFECVYAYNDQSMCHDDYYKYLCPQTCQVCYSNEIVSCVNFVDRADYDCEAKAMNGDCTASRYWKRYDVKTNCTKSCCLKRRLYW